MRALGRRRAALLVPIFGFLLVSNARANTYVFVDPPGGTVANLGFTEDLKVTITTGAGIVDISVQNFVTGNANVGFSVSGIGFTYGSLSSPTATYNTAQNTGDELNITTGSGTNYTRTVGGYTADASDHWGVTNTIAPTSCPTSNATCLSTLVPNGTIVSSFTGGTPIQQVIGGPDGSNHYATNGSTANHDPFTGGGNVVHWQVTVAGVTSATTIVKVYASFGSEADDTMQLQLFNAPEPATFALLLPGAGLLFAFRRKLIPAQKRK